MESLLSLSQVVTLNNIFDQNNKISFDEFTVIKTLGSGAFGKVLKVSYKKTRKNYALKVISKERVGSLNLWSQLENEIKILAQCDHPNIIKLYSVFANSENVYLVLELAEGQSLFEKLKKIRKFPEKAIASLMKDIINAVAYLHSQSPAILHRDLKPENILICSKSLKIADFGWSNTKDDLRNTYCGTPDYFSPEMIKGSGHSEKLDIWTLGVLMYELIHGKAPFTPS